MPGHYPPNAAPAWGYFAELRPAEIDRIREAAPIAYVPWGAVEWHSLHAPTGLDSIKANGICAALAAETGGLVLPVIPLGVDTIKPYKGFSHTLDFSAATAASVAEELCAQLAEERFRVVVILTGHYPPTHTEALRSGASQAAASHPETRFEIWPDSELLGADFPADHAGATETSFQLLFAPQMVDLTALPDRRLTLDDDGLTGEDPRIASAERGARQLATAVTTGAARVRKLLEAGAPTPR